MRIFVAYMILLAGLLCAGTSRAQVTVDSDAHERAVDYFYLQAVSLLEQDSIDACFEMLEHCRALAPESSAVLYDLSAFYLFLGKDSIAHDMLEYIVAKEPENRKYSEALVNYYGKVNDKKSAIASTRRCCRVMGPRAIYICHSIRFIARRVSRRRQWPCSTNSKRLRARTKSFRYTVRISSFGCRTARVRWRPYVGCRGISPQYTVQLAVGRCICTLR